MKKILFLLFSLLVFSCGNPTSTGSNEPIKVSVEKEKAEIDTLLNQWHDAAGNANFDTYFSLMTEDAVFIGTDPTENWHKPEFKEWAKPYFDRGKAWDFTTLQRNIFTSGADEVAWFDELLETQMGICRGSGVVVMENSALRFIHCYSE